jgi:hypothetical protein
MRKQPFVTLLHAGLQLFAIAALSSLPACLAENPAEIPVDGDFLTSGLHAPETIIRAGQKLGPWNVDLGSVGLHVADYDVPSGVGHVLDLNGTRSGSLYHHRTR